MPRRFQFSLLRLLLLTLLLGELIYGAAYLTRARREEAIEKAKGERSRLYTEVIHVWRRGGRASNADVKRLNELDAQLKRLKSKP